MHNEPLISICIPSYNRPIELIRLLNSIDISKPDLIEVVICEDNSLKRDQIREGVCDFKKIANFSVSYVENKENFGYDRNLRELIKISKGKFIIFMGDDDEFIPMSLDKLIIFLQTNSDLGYVLKSHYSINSSGARDVFKYYNQTTFFDSGPEAYKALFRKSVFISGFTIKRTLALPFLNDFFDGTLLFQLYLLAEVVLENKSAYFDEPLTQQYEERDSMFGMADSEKHLYTSGDVTVRNSINFIKGFSKITEYIDKEHGLNYAQLIKTDMSKYFYPNLSIQRDRGIKTFLCYVRELNKLGYNCTAYYYIYVLSLIVFGKRICDAVIRALKNVIGKTPSL